MNNKRNIANTVYVTDNFKMFKKMPGNRAVSPSTVKRLIESFNTVGYIPTPIVCNESFEVIDGQNRLEACKQTNTPIAYLVIPGIGGPECISMNANGTKWKLMDYIDYYAEQQFKPYVLLKEFIRKNEALPLATNLWCLGQTTVTNQRKDIVHGEYIIDESHIDFAQDIADYLVNFLDIPSNHPDIFLDAIGVCFMLPEIDNDVLIKKIHSQPNMFRAVSSIVDVITIIEDVYNFKRRGGHVYLETLYYQSLEKANAGIKTMVMKNVKRNRERLNLIKIKEVQDNG